LTLTHRFHSVCIIGAGALCGWIGAGWSRAACNVSMLARGRTLDALQLEGLRIRTGSDDKLQTQTHKVHACASAQEVGPYRCARVLAAGFEPRYQTTSSASSGSSHGET